MRALTPKLAALLDKGLESHKSGDIDGAVASYNAVLKKRPTQPEALWLKGVALLSKGDAEAAVRLIQRASRGLPEDPDILNDLGIAQEAIGAPGAARASFEGALRLNPDRPATLVNIARCLFLEGDSVAALEAADRLVAQRVFLGEAQNIRGSALKQQGRFEEALAAFNESLVHAPDVPIVLNNKGELQRVMGDHAGAGQTLRRAATLSVPGSKEWVNATMTLGLLFAKTGKGARASDCYDAVLSYVPGHLATLINRGDLHQTLGNIEAAEADYLAALAVKPDSAETNYNLSRLHLLRCHWSIGWDLFEHRWGTPELASQDRARALPVWDGSMSPDIDLVVWGEQGLGDQILFASQLPDLLSGGVNVSLETDPRLVPLFQRSFPNTNVFAYGTRPELASSSSHMQVPFGSLGRFLRRSEADFARQSPFLVSDPGTTKTLRERYLERAQGRKIVGISWHSINPVFGKHKSLPLEEWQPVLSHHPDTLFVSLQYGNTAEAAQRASAMSGADIFVDPEVNQMADFEAAVAQIAAMDLVVATSNTAVHVAGALGKPTWVMVPKVPEWRWGLEGDSSPWYPSMKIYRQQKQGDWAPVLTALDGDLRTYLST